MYRSMRAPVLPPMLVALALLLGPACGPPNIGVNRNVDDVDGAVDFADPSSPDAFVDRFGEPDEWKNEGEGDRLRMTAIWHCLDGRRREVTWRIRDNTARQGRWQLVDDRRSDGDCD